MNSIVKVHQDTSWSFFAKYDKLGALEKKIWQMAVWWVKRFPSAHPSQTKLSEKVGCSREHVNRAFSKFKDYGWIHLISRGHKRSKIISIPEPLIMIDVVKREYFKRIEITSDITHSYSNYKSKTSRRTGPLVIPNYLQKLNISLDAKLKLSLVPEYIYQETKYQCQKKAKSGWKPDNEVKYLVGAAIRMAQNKGHKLEWEKYYQFKGS
jgi:hypothetical protein